MRRDTVPGEYLVGDLVQWGWCGLGEGLRRYWSVRLPSFRFDWSLTHDMLLWQRAHLLWVQGQGVHLIWLDDWFGDLARTRRQMMEER